MSEKELERFSEEDVSFEKFIKHKKYVDKERKKSLRDFRPPKDKKKNKIKEMDS